MWANLHSFPCQLLVNVAHLLTWNKIIIESHWHEFSICWFYPCQLLKSTRYSYQSTLASLGLFHLLFLMSNSLLIFCQADIYVLPKVSLCFTCISYICFLFVHFKLKARFLELISGPVLFSVWFGMVAVPYHTDTRYGFACRFHIGIFFLFFSVSFQSNHFFYFWMILDPT